MASSSENYPVPGYYFKVHMGATEFAFKEVSGLSVTIEYKAEKPGADSTTTPKKFEKVQPGNVTFKKGLVQGNLLTHKIFDTVFNLKLNQTHNKIKHTNVHVTLMNEKEQPVAFFMLFGAYPISWEMSNFDAMSKELAIETLVLGCSTIYVDERKNFERKVTKK